MIRWSLALIATAACVGDHDSGQTQILQLGACHDELDEPYTLGNIVGYGDILSIEAYADGCANGGFEICWDGEIFQTEPPQVDLVLVRHAKDPCGGVERFLLAVNLDRVFATTGPEVGVNVISPNFHGDYHPVWFGE